MRWNSWELYLANGDYEAMTSIFEIMVLKSNIDFSLKVRPVLC